MTEGSVETKIAQLAKRIDDQARFTRTVTVVCAIALGGIIMYSDTEIFGYLPTLMITSAIARFDTIVPIWRATEARLERISAEGQSKAAQPKPGNAPAAPESKSAPESKTAE